ARTQLAHPRGHAQGRALRPARRRRAGRGALRRQPDRAAAAVAGAVGGAVSRGHRPPSRRGQGAHGDPVVARRGARLRSGGGGAAMKGAAFGGGATERGKVQGRVGLMQLVAFGVADGDYALDIMRIKEIINPVPVTPMPKAPPFIEGVIELRGAILPLIDVRKRFDLPPTVPTRATKFLIVSVDVGEQRIIVGLVVDRVSEPLRVA